MADTPNPGSPPQPIIGGTPTPAQEPEPVERSQDAADWELYGRDHPKGPEIFSPEVGLREAFRQRQDEVADVLALGTEAQQQRHRDFVGTVRESGLDTVTAGTVYDVLTDAQLAEARGAPVNEAQVRAGQEQTRRELRGRYGAERAEQLLRETAQFVESQPKLKALLGRGGVGSNPKVALALVEHVRTRRR